MIVSIDERLFLHNLNDFNRVIVPLENKSRSQKNHRELTEDEITNLFLSMKEHYGIPENTPKNSK